MKSVEISEAIKTVVLECSDCRKPLAEVTEKSGKHESIPPIKIVAKCPYCGDTSFPLVVEHRYGLFGATVEEPSYPDGFKELTLIKSVKNDDVTYVVEVVPA